jgi:hypothetical protein
MCWNASVSMNTFLFVVFSSVIGLYNNVLTFRQALFFLSYGGMQLIEYFLWKFPNLNNTFSTLGFALIVCQPFFSILQLNQIEYMGSLLIGYFGFLIYSIYIALNPKQFGISFSSTVASNGHLKWNWLPINILFLSIYLVLMFIPLYLLGNTLGVIAGLTTLIFSLVTYGYSKTWGSIWCWLAAMYSFIIIGRSVGKSGYCFIT